MQYMVLETFKAGMRESVYERFANRGRLLPAGLHYVDSWVESDGDRCFQLMETNDESLFQQWIAEWDDLVEFEVIPVHRSPGRNTGA